MTASATRFLLLRFCFQRRLALGMPLVPLLAKELMECVGGGKGKGPPIERALGANHHLTTNVLREVYLVNAFTHSDVCAF